MVTIQELQEKIRIAKEEEKKKRNIAVKQQLTDTVDRIIKNAEEGNNITKVSYLLYEEVVDILTNIGFSVETTSDRTLVYRTTTISFPFGESK